MADTGAPWNIPYQEPADIVRDYPAASEDLADAIAAGLTAAGNAGIGSNVVQTVLADAFTSGSSSFTDVTGLTATITPSSTSSKVLVFATTQGASTTAASNSFGMFRLMRGATAIGVANAAGIRAQATGILSTRQVTGLLAIGQSAVILDSPATDEAITYAVQVRVGGGEVFINRMQADDNEGVIPRGVSTLTLIEVKA